MMMISQYPPPPGSPKNVNDCNSLSPPNWCPNYNLETAEIINQMVDGVLYLIIAIVLIVMIKKLIEYKI